MYNGYGRYGTRGGATWRHSPTPTRAVSQSHRRESDVNTEHRGPNLQPYPNRTYVRPRPSYTIHRASRHTKTHIRHHHNFHELRQCILSSLESLRKLQELT